MNARFCARLWMPLLSLCLAGCVSQELLRAPAAPDRPWPGDGAVVRGGLAPAGSPARRAPEAGVSYGVPAVAPIAVPPPAVRIDPGRPLDLLGLIDIAQRENPHTRQAWNAARRAALGVGAVEASFLPMLSASVLAGQQETRFPVRDNVLGIDSLQVRSHGVTPLISLTWLLFDFGQRSALLDGAQQVSFAANVIFNAAHQKVIRDVTERYHQYVAARGRVAATRQALSQQQQVLAAAQARYQSGVGTTVDVALARQAVAQARLQVVNGEGLEKNAYLSLLGALGLAPDTRLAVADPPDHALPSSIDPMTRDQLMQALSHRPDVVAQYAALQAEQAKVRAAQAAFLPKVYLGAVYAHQNRHFGVGSLPEAGVSSTSSGVMLGVTLPLFEGGLRRNRIRDAQIGAQQAQADLQTLQQDALREMVATETVLQSALQSHEAAHELVRTAQLAYDAALAAYQEGVGTITMSKEAASQLLMARLARTDARHAALVAAANLAFVTGSMIRPRTQWLPPRAATRSAPRPPD